MRLFIVATALAYFVSGTDLARAADSPSLPPAAVGQPCTNPGNLRGSDAKAPDAGDVATVAQLCASGVSAATLDRVPFSDGSGSAVEAITIARDRSLHPLSALGTPESATMDIRSRNGNWTHLYSGAFWRAPAITANGEIQAIDRGHATFSVSQALGYFGVVLPRFLARVKGTVFDVDFTPDRSAGFSVSEGTVAITRTVAIRLRDENRTIDGIRETDVITAGGKSSIQYALPLPIEHVFQNESEATHEYTQQLQSAITSGDPEVVEDALNNISIVGAKPIVFVPPHLAHATSGIAGTGTVGTVVVGVVVAVATVIATGILKATKSPAAGDVGGHVTVNSAPRRIQLGFAF